MSSEQVWYRFEAKKKDGSVMKLRIQDLPPGKLNDALDLLVNIFARDEAIHRAVDVVNNSQGMDGFRNFYEHRMSNSLYHMVICCADDTPDVTNLMGISMTRLNTDIRSWIEETVTKSSPEGAETLEKPQEIIKLREIAYEFVMSCNPVTQLNVNAYFHGICMVVDPTYRGLGIAEMFFKARRLMCKAHGVKMTAAWMTGFGIQIAATRDGWETVKEIEYDYLAKKYDVTFTDVPRTMKFMIARVGSTGSAKKLTKL